MDIPFYNKFLMPCCNGCSVHYDYDDFCMENWKWAHFGPKHWCIDRECFENTRPDPHTPSMQRTDDVNGLRALNILRTIGQRAHGIKSTRTKYNTISGQKCHSRHVRKRFWPRRDSNTQPSDLESDALPLRHGVKLCEVLPRFELGSLDSKSRVLTITP